MNPAAAEGTDAFLSEFEGICRRIAMRAADADRSASMPNANWTDLVESGYLRLFHPRPVGGSAAGATQQILAMERLARACAGTFWTATVSTLLCGKMLHVLFPERHHHRWLRGIIAGELIGCFAASERGAGSDPASYEATLVDAGGYYVLSGEKCRISNAGVADVAVVLARHRPRRGPSVEPGLCYVVVDLKRAGVTRRELDKLGLRAMSWGVLTFDGVKVAAEDVIFDADMDRTLDCVEWGQLLQACCAIGVAQSALAEAVVFAQAREAFGRPITHLQVVHARLADMWAEIDASRLLTLDAASTKATEGKARDLVAMAKIQATEMGVRVVDDAMRTLAGWGYSSAHQVERLYRDVLANIPAGLTNDRLRELLACPLVGADPWTYEPFDWLSAAGLRI